MKSIKEIQHIKALISKGKEKGFLTFQELNDALPSDINEPEQFEEIINLFEQLEISIVDEQTNKKIEIVKDIELDFEQFPAEEDKDISEPSRSTDPVRMYLHEMGLVPYWIEKGKLGLPKKSNKGN